MSESKKAITHVVTTLGYGGAERQLLSATKDQVMNGWKVTVVFLKRPSSLLIEFQENGCEVLPFWMWVRQILDKGVERFRKENPLVHAHLPRSELAALFLFKLIKIPYLVSRHNAEPFRPNGSAFISRILSSFVIKNSSAVVGISYAVRDFLIESNEIPKNQISKLRVIHYGIALRRESRHLEVSTRRDGLTVGTIGRLVPQKDTATLLKAVSHFNKKHIGALELNTKIVGSGILKNELQGLAQILNIGSRVEWIDSLDDVSSFLRGIDIFVLPSLYEGFGLVLLEAMQENIPVLATRTTSIPEVMGRRYEGLFEVGNFIELERKLEKSVDPVFRRCLTEGYGTRLANFSSEKSYKKLSMLYEELALEEEVN